MSPIVVPAIWLLSGACAVAGPALARSSNNLQADFPPQFSDYPAKPGPIVRPVAPKLTSRMDFEYRSRLRRGLKDPPNFAGHYRMVLWGCGTQCVTGAAVDKNSGRITFLPFTVCCSANQSDDFKPIAFRRESNLIIFSGLLNETPPEGSHFYIFDGRSFVYLRPLTPK